MSLTNSQLPVNGLSRKYWIFDISQPYNLPRTVIGITLISYYFSNIHSGILYDFKYYAFYDVRPCSLVEIWRGLEGLADPLFVEDRNKKEKENTLGLTFIFILSIICIRT